MFSKFGQPQLIFENLFFFLSTELLKITECDTSFLQELQMSLKKLESELELIVIADRVLK